MITSWWHHSAVTSSCKTFWPQTEPKDIILTSQWWLSCHMDAAIITWWWHHSDFTGSSRYAIHAGITLEGDVSNVIALDQPTLLFSPRKVTRMSPLFSAKYGICHFQYTHVSSAQVWLGWSSTRYPSGLHKKNRYVLGRAADVFPRNSLCACAKWRFVRVKIECIRRTNITVRSPKKHLYASQY